MNKDNSRRDKEEALVTGISDVNRQDLTIDFM